MNFIAAIRLFLLKVLCLGGFVGYVIQRHMPVGQPPTLLHNRPYSISFIVVSAVLLIDAVWIYPRYRYPLRHVPLASDRDTGQILFESPRGKSALRWMRNNPDAQLLLLRRPFGVNRIICAGPDALREVLNTRVYDFEKPWGLRAFLARAIGFGLVLSEGADHKKQRKSLTPAFHIPRIRMLYGLMWEKTLILLQQLEADAGSSSVGTVEISEWSSRLTLDIIGPAAMGRDFQSLISEENPIADAFLELLRPSRDRLLFMGLHFIIPEWIIRRLPLKTNKSLNEIGGFLRETCSDIISEKKIELYEKKELSDFDILSRIMQTMEFTDQELIDQMLTFLAAGHETTASALTWACYLCAKHPEIQQKLRAEIQDKITSSASPVNWEVLEGMPYLNGVCEETLRLYPTVSVTIREAVRDTTVAGYSVPKGTGLLLVPYAINRHPRFWGDDADKIVPERWIDQLPDGTLRPNKMGGQSTNFAELTFLHGPRSCIGKDFAKAELRCALAGVVGKFEIELLPGSPEPKVTGVITMKPDGGLYLKMRPLAW